MSSGEDLYGLLGVSRSATTEEIHRAYRRRARTAHPDVATGAAADMAAVNEAWRVLRDPTRRRAYDQSQTGAHTPPPATARDGPDEGEDADLEDERPIASPADRLLRTMVMIFMVLAVVVGLAIFLIGFGRMGTG